MRGRYVAGTRCPKNTNINRHQVCMCVFFVFVCHCLLLLFLHGVHEILLKWNSALFLLACCFVFGCAAIIFWHINRIELSMVCYMKLLKYHERTKKKTVWRNDGIDSRWFPVCRYLFFFSYSQYFCWLGSLFFLLWCVWVNRIFVTQRSRLERWNLFLIANAFDEFPFFLNRFVSLAKIYYSK